MNLDAKKQMLAAASLKYSSVQFFFFGCSRSLFEDILHIQCAYLIFRLSLFVVCIIKFQNFSSNEASGVILYATPLCLYSPTNDPTSFEFVYYGLLLHAVRIIAPVLDFSFKIFT